MIAGGAVMALLAFLVVIYGNSREHGGKLEERLKWNAAVAERDAKIAKLNLENANAPRIAAENYAKRIERFEPIIVRSTETVTRFAQTPAGRVLCLDSERVRGIEETASLLGFPAPTATGSAGGTVPANAAPAIP